MSAPEAEARACSLGHPSRGATNRRSARPQLSMARAAEPMLTPSCGRTSTIAGPGFSGAARRALRVPAIIGSGRPRAGAEKLVGNRVVERVERGVDDVGRDAHGGPTLTLGIMAFDNHARYRLGAFRRCQNPHFV